MRSVRVVALLLVLLPWVVAGCRKTPPETADAPQPPMVSPTEPPTPAPTAPETSDQTGYAGTWGMVVSTIVLEADGTGHTQPAYPGEKATQFTWRTEGDHIVIVSEGNETTGQLTADGSCLLVTLEHEAGMTLPCVRLSDAAREQLASVPEANQPALERAREKAKQASCLSNVKQLSLAVMMYTADYDDHYPRIGGKWDELTYPYVKNRDIYKCPSDAELPSYAFNGELLGRIPADVPNPAWFIMLFESDDAKTVAYRHNSGSNCGFADGHCKWYAQGAERAGDITWSLRPTR